MEGAPVICRETYTCLGIIIPPLIRRDVKGFDLSFFIPWPLVRKYLADIVSLPAKTINIKESNFTSKLREACQSVALITISDNWGTGVIVSNKGHILTNGHVVRPFLFNDGLSSPIRVRYRNTNFINVTVEAKLLFVSSEFWDLAVLKVDVKDLAHLVELSPEIPEFGDVSVAVGYGGFTPAALIKSPSISVGVFGKSLVNPRNEVVARLQSSTLIQNGASGGALLRFYKDEFQLVGILTSNLIMSSNTVIPFITYAVPIHPIKKLLSAYVYEEDASILNALAFEGDDFSLLWTREPPRYLNKKNWASAFVKRGKL
ncbi:trypsin-like cysteine/serine peptidase domain-containing protein [Chytridium lagenaria]|nr:trypsin-like cysteine/serine peptidase domain-containing protein [Chytridium lagenaria]